MPVVLATLHYCSPGWHKVVLPRARGHFSAQSFRLARCLHTPALRDAFNFFFVTIISSFPTWLFFSTFLHRTVGRHLAAYAGRSPRTLSPFRFFFLKTRYEFEISASRNNRTRARHVTDSTVVVAAVYGPTISFPVRLSSTEIKSFLELTFRSFPLSGELNHRHVLQSRVPRNTDDQQVSLISQQHFLREYRELPLLVDVDQSVIVLLLWRYEIRNIFFSNLNRFPPISRL